MKTTWEEIKNQIGSCLPKNSFSLWIKPISFIENKGGTIVLGCPNRFSRDWVTENYLGFIQNKYQEAVGTAVDLNFKVQRSKERTTLLPLTPGPEQLTLPSIPSYGNPGGVCLNKGFTFDRFIVGRPNEFAYSASKSIAAGQICDYHSLLMLAGTGLGKTHLAHAVGHAVLERNPETRVFYITAEDFTNQMISSLKSNRIEEFKKKYRRSCDVLLLDEIHFLSGKEKTQIELGYTLDALVSENKRVIFTSALSPKDIPKMSKELSSRLTSGLVTTIGGPDYDTRVEILRKKASEHRLAISEEIIRFLAERLKRDVRQMESALKCLKARSHLLKARIDLDLAKEIVKALVSEKGVISTGRIKKLVSKYYKIAPDMLHSKSRKQIYAYPRNIYSYLCRRYTDESLADIAKTINRSHSTVLYACELVEHKMKTDRKLKHQVGLLCKRLEDMEK